MQKSKSLQKLNSNQFSRRSSKSIQKNNMLNKRQSECQFNNKSKNQQQVQTHQTSVSGGKSINCG